MKLTHDHLIYRLFLHGYSFLALGALLKSYNYEGLSPEFCCNEAEDAVRREVNRLRQHKRGAR